MVAVAMAAAMAEAMRAMAGVMVAAVAAAGRSERYMILKRIIKLRLGLCHSWWLLAEDSRRHCAQLVESARRQCRHEAALLNRLQTYLSCLANCLSDSVNDEDQLCAHLGTCKDMSDLCKA